MKKPFALLTCSAFVLSGCQMISETHQIDTKTTYSDLWTSAEVAADERIHSAQQTVNPDTDPNRILTSKTETGNREYLFADSIKQENGKTMALIEYRYAQTQKLPSNGLPYTHNHWFEEIDCANKIRTVRTTTHYNAQGEIVDANEYPAPKLTSAQMKLLAQPDDGVIKEVCQRIGSGKPSVSGSPESETQTHTPTVSGNPDNQTAASMPTVSGSPDNQPATQTPTVSGSQNVDNADTAPAPQTASEVVAAPPIQENDKTAKTKGKNKRNKKDKTPTSSEPSESNAAPQVDFVKQSKQQNQTDTLPESQQTEPLSQTEMSVTDDNAMKPLAPQQQDELPADFWTIGEPKE